MGPDEFFRQLGSLGFEFSQRGQYAIFKYCIPLGTMIGETITLALIATNDFPLTPPPGPHVSPRLGHPNGAVHASDLGPDWEYWSRPFPGWPATDRTVKAYMAHVRHLFSQR
jgi:hypothetical protein